MGGDRQRRPTNGVPRVGVPHRVGRYRPERSPFLSPVRWSGRCMEGFMIRGWTPTLHSCRWLHELRPISDQPVGLGLPYRAGRYRPGGPPFSPPVRRSCGGTEGFMIRRWDPILHGWRWRYEPRFRIPRRAGRYRPRGNRFREEFLRTPANLQSTSGVRVSQPCRTISTGGFAVFVPCLFEL